MTIKESVILLSFFFPMAFFLFSFFLFFLCLFPFVFFIIEGFRTIVFIFIVIYTTFRPICPPAFFRYLSNSGTFTELRITSFIASTEFACSDSVDYNRVQVLGIPVLLFAWVLQTTEEGRRTYRS